MKSKSVTYSAGLFVTLLLGCGVLAAQEVRTFEAAVPAPPPGQDGDVMYFFNDADEDDGPEMAFFEAEPEMVTTEGEAELAGPPMHHYAAGHRVMIHGEERPWLGVMLTDLDSEQAKGTSGVLVKDVREKSPAAQAGMMKDDIITDFAGEKVRSAAQLRRLVRETPLGRSVTIVVSRGGKPQTLNAKLEARHDGPVMGMGAIQAGPEPLTMPLPAPRPGQNFEYFIQRGARLGISGDDLTTQLAEYFGVKQGKGVLVREVIVGSAAEKAGLKAGDVIVAVDGQEIAGVGKLRRALAGGKPGEKPETEKRKVTLTIVRDKHEQPLSVELDSPDKGMPKPAMRAEILLDKERFQEMADEYASTAKEIGLAWQEHAKTFQSEWQSQMQQEMEKLRKELPKLQEGIQKQKASVKAQMERI
jgi:serine protease Do